MIVVGRGPQKGLPASARKLAVCVAVFLLFVVAGWTGVPWLGAAPGLAQGGGGAPEEDAQRAYLEAMQLYDQQQYDGALKKLKEAEAAAKQLPDKTWRASVAKTLKEAKVGVLYEAGLTAFKKDAFETAYKYFDQCLVFMPGSDKRKPTVKRSMVKAAYMLTMQLWLNRKYDRARETARAGQTLAKEVFAQDSQQRERFDQVHFKITMEHTDEMVARGEIQRAYDELKKDFAIQDDPRFAYQLGELGTQLKAFTEAERYFAIAKDKASGRAGEQELADLVQQTEEKLVQIKSLRRTITVKSNVPFYQVEVYRPFRELPVAEQQPKDAQEGARFELYPGRYRIHVASPDHGVCVREDVNIGNADVTIECSFEKPPTSVSIDTTPSGVRVRVVPSTMVAFRRTPFYTELYRGSYTLLVEMDDYPGTIEVPFVVESEGAQDFHFDLDYAEVDIQLPAEQRDASVRVDGRVALPSETGMLRVGIGSHMVEVSKPGFEPYRQRMFFKPREVKTLFVNMTEMSRIQQDPTVQASVLDIGLQYGVAGTTYEAKGEEANVASALKSDFIMHTVGIGARVHLTRDKEANIKPYIPIGVDLGFAVSRPIQSIFGMDTFVGFGLAFDQLEQSRWNVEVGYRFVFNRWNDEFENTRHRLETIQPLGFLLRGGGHWALLHASARVSYTGGSGRRDDFAFVSEDGIRGCSTDASLGWLDAEARVGVDLVDAFGYRDDLDVVVGGFGGVLWYDEEQESTTNGGNTCRALPKQTFTRTDARAGAGLSFRYATRSAPRFSIFGQADLFFLGGFIPQTAPIYDGKTTITPEFGNFRTTLGFELGF